MSDSTEEPGSRESFVDADQFRAAMRQQASSVAVVAAGQGDARRGLTATSVCSLSTDPPMVIACIDRRTDGHRAIVAHGRFCINLLSAGQADVAGCFAGRGDLRGADRFRVGAWSTLVTGAPVLEGASVAIDCDVVNAIDQATHTIFIGGVRGVKLSPWDAALVYCDGAFATLASSRSAQIVPGPVKL
ncbi:MAG: flavin reductase [Rhodospirillaceae bacterium]|jgi:flavin reductase (DIM6/NTAB) family NADH-FMN oxidoreductase RutF|nr:flavin reductase [Rhodospirillaceae bacterium]